MRYSLHDHVRVAVPSLPPSLASAETIAAITALARSLPPTADFGFESRLREAASALDFFVRIRELDGSRAAFAGRNLHAAIPDELLAADAWRGLRQFCQRWHEPHDPFHEAIADMWLELDAAVHAQARPTPCIFFHLRDRGRRAVVTTEDGCRALFSRPDFALSPLSRRCLLNGVAGGWVEHVGLMLSRPDQPLRFVVVGLQAEAIDAALDAVGWTGDRARLGAYRQALAPYVSGCSLAIDLADCPRPRIGIEYFLGGQKPVADGALAQFLGRCVDLGLARADKADALVGWRGVVPREALAGPWPSNLAAGEERFGLRSAFYRHVNHFKLVYCDDEGPEMKAYFGMTHVWLPPEPVSRSASDASV